MEPGPNREYICSIVGNDIERKIWDKYNSDVNVYLTCAYQTIGDVLNNKDNADILSSIEKGEIDWNHSFYDNEKHAILEQDDFIEHPFEVEEGVLECRCGSKRVYSFSKQTRSADEPMTTYAECVECNSKWQYSG